MKAIMGNFQTNWRHWVTLPVLLVGLFSIIATGGGGGNGGIGVEKVAVNGTVTGSGGIGDVTISAGGVSTTSDANGFYALTDVPIPAEGPLVLTYEKQGYATFQRAIPVENGETYSVAANLMAYHYSEEKDAAQVQDLNILDPGNPDPTNPLAEVNFPAGSIASSGMVTINVGVGDPTTAEGAAVFPGDYMAASTAGGDADTPVESIAFTEITVTDDQGAEITQLSEPATLTVRLPDAMQTKYSAGDTIEWWSYDETNGTWIREDADPSTAGVMDDAAIIDLRGDGVLYAQAKVTHFTWWNVDEPVDQHACLCTKITNADGAPMAGEFLTAAGASYTGVSRPARTNEAGDACVTIKRSSDTTTEQIDLYAEFGGIKFHYDVTDPNEGDVTTDMLFTPTIPGSTVRDIPGGECINLASNIIVGLNGQINGTVTYEGSGEPVPNLTINTNYGETTTTDDLGEYTLSSPIGQTVSLYVVGLASASVNVPGATPVTVNLVIPNRDPQIHSVSRVPEGAVNNNQSVTLTVSASDPDGDALSYSWEVVNQLGDLNQFTGASVTWTAPATDAGTALVRVTASDGYGGETSEDVSIVFSPASVGGTQLSLLIKDNRVDEQPLAGVIVALYNTDNRTVQSTMVSNSNGVVDFGDVGRERVTLTIAYEDDAGGSSLFRYLDSFIEVPTAEGIVFYVQENTLDFGSPGKINIGLDPIVYPGAGVTTIDPTTAWWSHAAGTGQLNNISVYNYEIQNNGKLTLLAQTHDSSNSIIKWGMLEEQTVNDGDTYTISLNHDPVVVGWTTNPSTELDSLSIIGDRKGVEYQLYSTSYNFTPSATGSTPIATEFPVDEYWIWAEDVVSSEMTLASGKVYSSLPQTIEVPVPNYNLSSVVYNSNTDTLSWSLSGTSPSDILNINLDGMETASVQWSIGLSPGSNSWHVMELPSQISSWVNTDNLGSTFYQGEIEVVDFDFLSGSDETWSFFITGGDLMSTTSQLLTGRYDFSAQLVGSPQAQALSATGQQSQTKSLSNQISRSLSGLRRR